MFYVLIRLSAPRLSFVSQPVPKGAIPLSPRINFFSIVVGFSFGFFFLLLFETQPSSDDTYPHSHSLSDVTAVMLQVT